MAAVLAVAAAPGTASAEPAAPTTPDVQSMIENLLRGLEIPGLPTPGNPMGDTSQMVMVSMPSQTAVQGTLTAFEKDANGQWKPIMDPVPAFVGSKGIGKPQDNVHRTPEGTFAFGKAFGRLDNPGTKLPYTKVDRQDWWDGNVASPTYNRMVRQPNSPGPGSENLYDMGPAYDYSVQMVHNPTNTPGNASAIFLHVGSEPTWGCVAIPLDAMKKVLQWLDPAKNPKITVGVNTSTPTDIKDAPSVNDPQGSPLGDDALAAILNQFTAVIPQLLDTVAGS